MNTLENRNIRLELSDNGREVRLVDRKRSVEWRLDPSRQTFRRLGPDGNSGTPEAFPVGRVERRGEALSATYPLQDGSVDVLWELDADHVRIRLSVSASRVEVVDLPGVFRPADGAAQLLLPTYQGTLYRGGDEPWQRTCFVGAAHDNFSLSMAATLSQRGALLTTVEDLADCQCQFGEDQAGPFFTFQPVRCKTHGWYEREIRLYPEAPDITAIMKRYRARLKERNEFVSWDEKIARKPIVENLFGSLMAFTGYNQASEIDYAACARRLHDYGFERVLYYPVRMCNYSIDFRMGGDPPVWLSDDELSRLKQVPGALVSPWGWYIEGIDDGSERMARIYRRDPQGGCYDNWRIEGHQWKLVCTPYQVEESKRRFAGDMREMDWIHYDVNATAAHLGSCHSIEHELHECRPMGKREEVEWTRRLLGPETNGNRIVSSEGFVDRYATSYDIGSTKMLPGRGNRFFTPVPMTMLALHDSCLSDWWELHNYNAVPGFGPTSHFCGQIGSGEAAKKAAMDALYGCPPNVFPFGRQYSWVDVNTRRTFSFLIKLEDAEVQNALRHALPVARFHKRVGKQALASFEMLSDDGLLQATTFADGTRVVANLGDRSKEADCCGKLPPDTWREIKAVDH